MAPRIKRRSTPEPRPWTQPGAHGPYAHNPEIVSLYITSKPDGLGRQSFFIIWWDEGWEKRRAQHFHMRVKDYLANEARAGYRWVVVVDA